MLTGVTITGADESVTVDQLLALSERFPFVEWGILFSRKRQGLEPRYPGVQWLSGLWWARPAGHWSAHLCGEQARKMMAGDDGFLERWKGNFRRVQLNGGRVTESLLAMSRERPWCEVIVQAGDEAALASVLNDGADRYGVNVSALFDPSGGRGLEADRWPPPPEGLRVGYAGGIDAVNIERVVKAIAMGVSNAPFWVDMESGVRTGNRFDVAKVTAVLEAAAPLVAAPPGTGQGTKEGG